ncbi:MAG: exosortase H [candidate division Zixibacteria bacterium RBG_16_48_11]|nr:MAG: exosortase H [candidate division Zixibacteria bacterium RBG_16_48_11]
MSQLKKPGLLQGNRPILRAFAIFTLSIAVFFIILMSHVLDKYFVYPFTVLVVKTTSVILDTVGYDTSVKGTVLKTPDASLNIGTGCNGLEAVIIFVSAILAFPANLKNKLVGLLLGFLGIYIINQTRVIGLFFVNSYASEHLELAHTYIGQTYVIISGVILWIVWAERFSRDGKKAVNPAA